jgi:hypothetical protein
MTSDRKKPTAGFWITVVLVAVLVLSGQRTVARYFRRLGRQQVVVAGCSCDAVRR